MQFLWLNETAAWCRERQADVDIDHDWSLKPDPRLTHSARIVFAPSGSEGLEPKVAGACLNAIRPWESCLLWIREWGIWPSSEDWPAFYEARGARGERYSLHEKPGHLFGSTDQADLPVFLDLVLRQGWGGHLLPLRGGRIDRRIWVSHDGWVELYTSEPAVFELATA